MKLTTFFTIALLGCGGLGCTSQTSQENSSALTQLHQPTDLSKRGKTIYQTQCIACHNSNPHKAGSLGPDVFGSSHELLDARIMHSTYPEGVQPKRQTHIMVALPHLKNEIDAIHAYLNDAN